MHLIVHEKSKSHTDLGNNIRVFSDDRRCRPLPVGLLPGSAGVRRLAVVLKFSRIVRTSITGHLYAGFLNHAVNKTIKFTYHTVLQTQQNVWGKNTKSKIYKFIFYESLVSRFPGCRSSRIGYSSSPGCFWSRGGRSRTTSFGSLNVLSIAKNGQKMKLQWKKTQNSASR